MRKKANQTCSLPPKYILLRIRETMGYQSWADFSRDELKTSRQHLDRVLSGRENPSYDLVDEFYRMSARYNFIIFHKAALQGNLKTIQELTIISCSSSGRFVFIQNNFNWTFRLTVSEFCILMLDLTKLRDFLQRFNYPNENVSFWKVKLGFHF